MFKHEFTKQAKLKGWTAKDIAKRWKIKPRQFSRIAANPKQIHIDALTGLEDKTK